MQLVNKGHDRSPDALHEVRAVDRRPLLGVDIGLKEAGTRHSVDGMTKLVADDKKDTVIQVAVSNSQLVDATGGANLVVDENRVLSRIVGAEHLPPTFGSLFTVAPVDAFDGVYRSEQPG